MRIAVSLGSEAIGSVRTPAEVVQDACDVEAAGFRSGWMVHMSRGVDALSVLAVAATRTSRLELGVGVVPTYPRHPHALAQQAATVQSLARGRLTLGVGVSHRPVVEGLFGLPYATPAEHLRDYLGVLVPLLRDGSVTHRGRFYAVEGGFTVPGTSPVSVVVGALGPKMIAVGGECADGVVTWLAGPRHLQTQIGPWLREAAQRAGRPAPRLVAAVPVAVCPDEAAGRAAAASVFARYEGMDNYRRLMHRQGLASVADVAIVGDEAAVGRGLQAFADAGVTEVWATAFPVPAAGGAGDDGGLARTRTVLADLASAAPAHAGGA